jgi:hypothetical protein
MNHTATVPRPSTRGRWTALNIVLMIIGFAVFWPLGLAMLAWIIWGDEIAAKAEEAKAGFSSFRDRAQNWQGPGSFGRTGNAAFDEYRRKNCAASKRGAASSRLCGVSSRAS